MLIVVILNDDFNLCMKKFHDKLSSLLDNSVTANFYTLETNNLHLSLSRTVPIQYHWIDPLTKSLQSHISKHRRYIHWNFLYITCPLLYTQVLLFHSMA